MLRTQAEKQAIAHRAKELYETQIRSKVEKDFDGKILAIDINSGDYEIDEATLPAINRLQARHDTIECYVMRIGYKVVYSFHGFMPRQSKQ